MSAGLHFVRALKMSGEVGDRARFQRLIIRRLIDCLLAHVGKERPVASECPANSVITMLFWLKALQLRFTIEDWTIVPVIEVTTKRQVLQINELILQERDGLETSGLAGMVDDKPVVAVTASAGLDPLFIRIGGFNDAAISHDDGGRIVAVLTPCTKPVD